MPPSQRTDAMHSRHSTGRATIWFSWMSRCPRWTAIAIREKEKTGGNHLPVIALTAHAMKGDQERYLEAGMDGYLSKPVRPQELDELLDKHVARRMELAVTSEGQGRD